MKVLAISEIHTYLPISKIQEILSGVLLHRNTEDFLDNKEKRNRWVKDKEIYISNAANENDFSNENWIYYLPIFKKLQPKALTINSTVLKDVSGIETIESLEEIFIGSDEFENHCFMSQKEVNAIFDIVAKLPKLKKINLYIFSREKAHNKFIEESFAYIQSLIPTIRRDVNNRSPLTFLN